MPLPAVLIAVQSRAIGSSGPNTGRWRLVRAGAPGMLSCRNLVGNEKAEGWLLPRLGMGCADARISFKFNAFLSELVKLFPLLALA